MIKLKGSVVTFTGRDEKQLMKLAASLNKTPQETFELAIREYCTEIKNLTKKTKRSK